MQVISLGVQMAKRKNQYHLVKKEPQSLQEVRPKNFEADYQRRYDEENPPSSDDEDGSSDSDDDGKRRKRKAAAANSDDEWNNVAVDRKTRRTDERNAAKKA